jgi:apolipoprotein D and lipocalin family protein
MLGEGKSIEERDGPCAIAMGTLPWDNGGMNILGLASVVILVAATSGPKNKLPPVETVNKVDLARYMGKWFEIAAFPQRFQKGCHCTTAEYELMAKGYVQVVNTCRRGGADGKVSRAKGKAWVVPGSGNARLKVQFFWPFKGNYWIIDLAEDYSYAVVGDPTRKYLWILSRTARMDPALYAEIVARAAAQGFDTSRLVTSDQSCF